MPKTHAISIIIHIMPVALEFTSYLFNDMTDTFIECFSVFVLVLTNSLFSSYHLFSFLSMGEGYVIRVTLGLCYSLNVQFLFLSFIFLTRITENARINTFKCMYM